MRLGVSLAVLGVAATLAWSATAATGTARGGSAKIAVPAVGHFSLTPITVISKSGKKPKLKVAGAVGKTLVVAAGLTADPKHKGRFIGAVALLNRKTTRSAQSARQGSGTFIVVSASGDQIGTAPSLREAICQYAAGNTIIADSGFLDNPPGPGGGSYMDAMFAASCPGHFGPFDGAPDGTAFLNGLVGGTVPPPPPPPPTSSTFTVVLSHVFGAGSSTTNDCETVTVNETGIAISPSGTLALTGPGGFSGTDQLTFGPGGSSGVFVARATFLLSSFGTYNESGTITVNGTTITQTGTWMIDSSNNTKDSRCSSP